MLSASSMTTPGASAAARKRQRSDVGRRDRSLDLMYGPFRRRRSKACGWQVHGRYMAGTRQGHRRADPAAIGRTPVGTARACRRDHGGAATGTTGRGRVGRVRIGACRLGSFLLVLGPTVLGYRALSKLYNPMVASVCFGSVIAVTFR